MLSAAILRRINVFQTVCGGFDGSNSTQSVAMLPPRSDCIVRGSSEGCMNGRTRNRVDCRPALSRKSLMSEIVHLSASLRHMGSLLRGLFT